MSAEPTIRVDELLRHRDFVGGLARALLGEGGEDAAQEAWLEACRRPPATAGNLRAWLGKAARHAAWKLRRGERRRVARERAAARQEAVPSAAEIVMREELRRELVEAVLALEEPCRSTIVLRFLEELPPREVARRLRCPVETVRTRTKRGLAMLRARLDRIHGGDRRAWATALAPLAWPAAGSGSKLAVVVAGVLLAGGGVALGLLPAGEEPPPGGPPAPASARVDASGGGAAPAVVGIASTSSSSRDEAVRRKVAATPAGELRLRSSLGRLQVTTREAVELRAVFENPGAGPVRVFVPEHVPLVPFPEWEVVAADGRRFVPAPAPFQSMWRRGVQGDVHEIGPGERFEVRQRFAFWFETTAGGDPSRRWKRVRLPIGIHRVRCAYRQEEASVPFSPRAFEIERKPWPGLWTGTVRAPDVFLTVFAPSEPVARVVADEPAPIGGPAWIEAVLENPTGTLLEVEALEVELFSKGGPDGRAVAPRALWRVLEPADGAPRAPAHGLLRVRVDLAGIPFRSSRFEEAPVCCYELVRGGRAGLRVRWRVRGRPEPIVADADTLQVDRRPRPIDGLTLRLVPTGPASLRVELVNLGSEPLRLPRRMTWPTDLRVELRRTKAPGGGGASVTWRGGRSEPAPVAEPAPIPSGLSWNGDRYESVAPLGPGDFAELPPGRAWTRELRLHELVDGGLPPGDYRVRVTWTALADGRHLGLAPAATGVLEGELRVRVR